MFQRYKPSGVGALGGFFISNVYLFLMFTCSSKHYMVIGVTI